MKKGTKAKPKRMTKRQMRRHITSLGKLSKRIEWMSAHYVGCSEADQIIHELENASDLLLDAVESIERYIPTFSDN